MKTLLALLIAALLAAGMYASHPGSIVIGSEVTMFPYGNTGAGSLTLAFDSSPSSGYDWTYEVLSGDAVMVNAEASVYVPDPGTEDLDGAGGTQYIVLDAAQPGESIVRFAYCSFVYPERRPIDEYLVRVTVDEDGMLSAEKITFAVLCGSVTGVDEAEHSVTVSIDELGEVIVSVPEGQALPENWKSIGVYTDGTMALSDPAVIYALMWRYAN